MLNEEMNTLEKLKHAGAAFRLNGLISCLENGHVSPEEEKEIRKLTKDDVLLAGRPLRVYAYAVLDLLGLEKYNGNDPDIKQIIEGLKQYTVIEEFKVKDAKIVVLNKNQTLADSQKPFILVDGKTYPYQLTHNENWIVVKTDFDFNDKQIEFIGEGEYTHDIDGADINISALDVIISRNMTPEERETELELLKQESDRLTEWPEIGKCKTMAFEEEMQDLGD